MRTRATIAIVIYVLIAAGLAAYLLTEHQAAGKLVEENKSLRDRLSQMDQLVAENHRLSSLVPDANSSSASGPNPIIEATNATANSVKQGPSEEMGRLRREVEALSQQVKEIQTMQADTREIRTAAETAAKKSKQALNNPSPTMINGSPFELVSADYWTEKTNLDVLAEMQERIREDGLKAVASNNLKGDPDFGQVKHLTIVYRFGGATMTNEFREGEYVVLPRAPEQ